MKGKLIIAFAIVLGFALASQAEAFDPSYNIYAYSDSAPSIDGVISSGEWNDAYTMSLNNTTVYIKQDGNNVYAAFNVSDNTVSLDRDGVAFAIDEDNSGGYSMSIDDCIFVIFRNATAYEYRNETFEAPTGWNAESNSNADGWQAEFNISYAKISIIAGEPKTLGAALSYNDSPNSYYWPLMSPSDFTKPQYWGNLVSEEDWIPEFQLFMMLLMLLMATLLAVAIHRKIRRSA